MSQRVWNLCNGEFVVDAKHNREYDVQKDLDGWMELDILHRYKDSTGYKSTEARRLLLILLSSDMRTEERSSFRHMHMNISVLVPISAHISYCTV